MTAGIYNFPQHRSGDTYDGHSFEIRANDLPVDLTGCSIKMQLKRYAGSSLIIEWKTSDASIVISGADNNVIQLQPKTALQMTIPAFNYLYDIEVTFPDTTVVTYVTGIFPIVNSITV